MAQNEWQLFLEELVCMYTTPCFEPQKPQLFVSMYNARPDACETVLVDYTKVMLYSHGLDPTNALYSLLDVLPMCRYFFEDLRQMSRMLRVLVDAGANTKYVLECLMKPVERSVVKAKIITQSYEFDTYVEGFDIIGWLVCIFTKWGFVNPSQVSGMSWWEEISAETWKHEYLALIRMHMKNCIMDNERFCADELLEWRYNA